MDRFIRVFGRAKNAVVGMVHVQALPGKLFYASFQFIGSMSTPLRIVLLSENIHISLLCDRLIRLSVRQSVRLSLTRKQKNT